MCYLTTYSLCGKYVFSTLLKYYLQKSEMKTAYNNSYMNEKGNLVYTTHVVDSLKIKKVCNLW